MTRLRLLLATFLMAASARAACAALPPAVVPPEPFPKPLTTALTTEFVAPGVTYYDYELWTKDGPLSIHAVDVDTTNPNVRIDTVLANDALISAGETPSSMAVRTGAVAGINADYFDIGNTNAPLGIVVRSGALVRTPNEHAGFALTRDHRPVVGPFAYSASATVGTIPVPLDGINVWPPRTGVALITPAFGSLPVADGLTVAHLTALDSAPATTARYRIDSVEPADRRFARQYALILSQAAQQTLGEPQPGDIVTIAQTSQPDLTALLAATGGGPILLKDGRRAYENNAPAAAEGRSRIPISAAAIAGDGTLLLLEVDGREPLHSIGLTRDEFVSFLIGLHARDAVSLDGGGSSALVSRRPGDAAASVRTEPSDGTERPVADGIFVYSDAPQGPPARLAVRPAAIHALTGARVELSTVVTDAAGHPRSAPQTQIVDAGARARDTILHLRRATVSADVPLHVSANPARLVIRPQRANVHAAGDALTFAVTAYDRSGFELALPQNLAWSASSGTISSTGRFTAADRDAVVRLRIGDSIAEETVSVGEHEVPLQLGTQWRYTTTPAGGDGSLGFGSACPVCITLPYDFTAQFRGATMLGSRPLPESAIGLRFDVEGDGNGEILRVSLTNAINERVFLTAAKVDWRGWKTVDVRIPPAIAAPVTLRSIYVLNALGGTPVKAAGEISIRNARILLAGKQPRDAATEP